MIDSQNFINMEPGTKLRIYKKKGLGGPVVGLLRACRSSQGFTNKEDDEIDLNLELDPEKRSTPEIKTFKMAEIDSFDIVNSAREK